MSSDRDDGGSLLDELGEGARPLLLDSSASGATLMRGAVQTPSLSRAQSVQGSRHAWSLSRVQILLTIAWAGCQDGLDTMERSMWADVVGEASFLLGELAGLDLIPEELEEKAASLSKDLAEMAFEMRRS
jgi:hypothetical protein